MTVVQRPDTFLNVFVRMASSKATCVFPNPGMRPMIVGTEYYRSY